jgi:hypothetical protein
MAPQNDAASPESAATVPMNIVVLQSSDAEAKYRIRAGASMSSSRAVAPGIHPTPDHDLVFHKGKTIETLTYTNFYVGGVTSWQAADIRNIDQALGAAMSDSGLNNVLAQYFPAMPTTTFKPSTTLPGTKPAHFSQGDIEQLVSTMHTQGAFAGFDHTSTVFNYIMPRGTILNDNPAVGAEEGKERTRDARNVDTEAADSSHGLGGYQGSIHNGGSTIYYAVGVYSERTSTGNNGIPVFDKQWKNVVATFYHELCEARTDADVEDAIKNRSNRFIGWASGQGEEIGDFPVFEASPLSLVFQEVPLAKGGSAPIQLMYSNAVHGPEGPQPTPHPFFKQ